MYGCLPLWYHRGTITITLTLGLGACFLHLVNQVYWPSWKKRQNPKLVSQWKGLTTMLEWLGQVVYWVRQLHCCKAVVLHRDRLLYRLQADARDPLLQPCCKPHKLLEEKLHPKDAWRSRSLSSPSWGGCVACLVIQRVVRVDVSSDCSHYAYCYSIWNWVQNAV